ncbi:MAG: hypothetical protein ABJP70_07020 [Erythrobacter sp.]
MYSRRFFDSKLGSAAFASIAAMVAMIAVSSQLNAISGPTSPIAYDTASIAIA